MARKPNVFPSYLPHRQSGQARIRINGCDVLLGPFGSEESRAEYRKLIASFAGGIPLDPIADSQRGSLSRSESDDLAHVGCTIQPERRWLPISNCGVNSPQG